MLNTNAWNFQKLKVSLKKKKKRRTDTDSPEGEVQQLSSQYSLGWERGKVAAFLAVKLTVCVCVLPLS